MVKYLLICFLGCRVAAGTINCDLLHIGPVDAGLYLRVLMTEGSGTLLSNSSGTTRNGVFTNWGSAGAISWTNGPFAGVNGIRFSGVNNGQSVIFTNAADNFDEFTVAFWVREIATTFHGYIVSKFRPSDGNYGWQVMSESGQLRYAEWETSNFIETPDTNPDAFITDGDWHFFVATRNGVSVYQSTTNALSYKDAARISGPLVYFGSTVNSITNVGGIKLGFNTEFDGSTPNIVLGPVWVYSRVLSLVEITNLFNWRP